MLRCLWWVGFDILEPRYMRLNVSLSLAIFCNVPKRRDSIFLYSDWLLEHFGLASLQSHSYLRKLRLNYLDIFIGNINGNVVSILDDFFTAYYSAISLRNIMNNRGAKIEPCGTPVRTSFA